MGKNKNTDYENLYEAWKAAYRDNKGDVIQKELNEYWKANKTSIQAIRSKINSLHKFKARQGISSYFKDVASSSTVASSTLADDVIVLAAPLAGQLGIEPMAPLYNYVNVWTVVDEGETTGFKHKSPAQDIMNGQINTVCREIARLELLRRNGFATTADLRNLADAIKKRTKAEKQLKRLQNVVASVKLCREKAKVKLQNLKEKFPQMEADIRDCEKRTGAGRPRIEETHPLLLKTIVDIVAPESCADGRRRSELLRACTTLDDLKKELERRLEGLQISRSGLYLRLIPKNVVTTQGKRHVKTVPVKLCRVHKDLRDSHADSHFANSLNNNLKELAELMGAHAVFVVSQDDKSQVKLGLAAASVQAPILMHLSYRVRLSDHDWVVAPKHKLIPSVYAGLSFTDRKLTYPGPTYVAIRSGKHDKSSAHSHALDLRTLVELDEFKALTKTGAGLVKPICIIFTDGGPDENPRFPKTIVEAANNFKFLDLDALFIACHAPRQSVFNQVERRMAPLCRDLSGIVLPHDYYGSHLDAAGNTLDDELEILNFEKAGTTLSEVWNGNLIDGYPVVAEYILPSDAAGSYDWLTEAWKTKHIKQSQYCCQIIKCSDESCCTRMRSNLKDILPYGFLPAPVKFTQTESGPQPCQSIELDGYFGNITHRLALSKLCPKWNGFEKLPFDFFCPSIQNLLEERTCKACGEYFVTKCALAAHKSFSRQLLGIDYGNDQFSGRRALTSRE